MCTKNLIKASVTAVTIALMAVGTALADRDDHGGGHGDRGGGGHGDGGRSMSSSHGDHGSSRGPSISRGESGSRGPTISRGDSGRSRSSDIDRSFRRSDSGRSTSQTFRESDRGPVTRSVQPSDSGRSLRGTQQYEARRPTEGNVRDFLNLGDKDRDKTDRSRDFDRDRSQRDRDRVDGDRNRDVITRDRGDFDRNRGQHGDFDHNRSQRDRDFVDRDWSGKWRDSDRFTIADRIRRDWRDRSDRENLFHGDWWRDHHRGNSFHFWGDFAFSHNRPWYWWSWATAPRLASWVVFGWPTPYYWDYGRGEYIYYDNGAIYVNGRWYEPAPVYYDQTVRIIEQAPNLTAETAANLEWMPLGVFAVTPDGGAEAEVTVQLAVTKDGVIGGTAFDPQSGAAFNIRGMVDKRTQRAVWSYANDRNNRVIIETSIYNLTQPEATGLVHYGPNDMRVVELVRLQEPGGESQSSGTTSAPPMTR